MGSSHSSKVTSSEKPEPTTTAAMIFDDALQEKINSLASAGASPEQFIALIRKEGKSTIESTEAFLRLTQAMIYHFNDSDAVDKQFREHFTAFIDQLSLNTEALTGKCISQLQPFFNNIPALSEQQHLHVCLFVYHLFGVGKLFRQCEWKPVVDYLVGVVQNSSAEHLPTAVLWAVLSLEQATRQGLDGDQLNSCLGGMNSRQRQLSDYFNDVKEADLYSADFDPLKFQVGFLLSNYLNVNYFPYNPPGGCWASDCIPPPPSPRIAICPPCPGKNFYEMEEPPPARVHYFPLARNDDWQWPTVRSALSLSGDAFYYEAVFITSGKKVAIGWATREANFSETKGVGSDQFGVAMTSEGLLHNEKILEKASFGIFKAGDVLGCLIDLNKRFFSFSLNGVELVNKTANSEMNFSSQPYFAAASLGPHEQVWFNYGQVPFKHTPNDASQFDSFDAVCGQDTNRYRLVAPVLLNHTEYCFKDILTWDAPVEAMFVDDKQDQLDRLLVDLEVGVVSEVEFKQQLSSLLESTDDVDQYAALRLFNSVLSEVGHRSKDDEEALEALFAILSPQMTAFTSKHPLSIVKILELLLPYSQDRSNDQVSTYQNVVPILLAILSASPPPEKLSQLFADELYYYLEDVLCRGAVQNSQNSQLYKLYAVQLIHRMVLLNAESKRRLRKQSRIVNQLKHNSRLAQKSSASAQAKSSFDRLRVKLATASQAALDAIYGDEQVKGGDS